MASLFGKNQLRELAQNITTEDIQPHLAIVREWHNDYHNGSLKKDKETSREQEYNHAFFKTILGYQEKPALPYSFEPKATTDKGQLPDAVIGYIDTTEDIKNIAAVVELKGAGIDLDRPQRREGNMSPVQQGFKYKTQYRSVPFVIVSNFWEFRLYHDNMLDYESWTLDELVDPTDDYIRFKEWYLLHHKDSLTTKNGQSKTEALITDIRIEQENIGKKFYKVYKEARIDLLRNIYQNNAVARDDIDFGIQKAQKIIDRIVFAAFAEDRGLLPDNTLHKVLAATDNSVFGGSLWNALKGFFEAIDKGSEKLEVPNGYNGGLFAFDSELNVLQIDDAPLRKVVELANYNFAEDLSVKILGHIFEQSISDLEEIKSKVNESKSLEAIAQGRRKKDGIFYTPDYIVRYIVDNSLGAYLREHEEKFKEEFGLKGDIQEKTYEKRERQAYTKYQDFLQNVKVVDPACGSGAFLVYVFDYLLAENQRVGDILGISLFSTDEYIRDILRNNIYGVDLNAESVEITKLSLWLKTAQKGKKLTALDDNIKCGNSLTIDYREVFPHVFASGGFDVVVANPPYVKEYTAKSAFDGLHDNPIYQGKMDLWYFFGAAALDILKPERGIVGLIAPSNWITNSGAGKFRDKILKDGKLIEFIDFGDFKVFDQAGIQTMIYIMRSSRDNAHYSFDYSKIVDSKIGHDITKQFLTKVIDPKFTHFNVTISREDSIGSTLNFNNARIDAVVDSLAKNANTHLNSNEIAQGIVAPQDYLNGNSQRVLGDNFKVGDGVFNLSLNEYASLNLDDNEKQIVKPFYTTSQLHRFYGNRQHKAWIIYTDSRFKDSSLMAPYPKLREHLDKFAPIITSDNKPYGLHRARDERFFTGDKIISLRKCRKPTFTYTDFDSYVSQTYFVIKTERMDMKSLTAILNSKAIAFWLRYKGKMQGDMYQVDKAPLLEVPIVMPDDPAELAGFTDKMIALTEQLHDKAHRFSTLIRSEFAVGKVPDEWWNSDFTDFVSSLGAELSLPQKDDLLQLFEKYRTELQQLDTQIQSTDHQIDQLVYKLYDLTPQEISVIEGSNG